MGRFTRRSRLTASVTLTIVGATLLLAGTLALYAREQIIDREAFANRAVSALEDDELRRVVGREIVVYLVDRGSTDLVAARPLLESVVGTVIQTDPFRRVFRTAASETNRVFFQREQANALFDLGNAAEVVRFGLQSVSPKVARQLPRDLEPDLVTLRRREFAGQTLAIADDVRFFGVLLPALAVVALVLAVAVAPDRRLAVLRSGVAVGVVGALMAIAMLVVRARTIAGLRGEDELTDEDVQQAGAGLLDAYFGDLFEWALLLALFGFVLAAAAAALDPEDAEQPLARFRRRVMARPESRRGRALRGGGLLVTGVLVVLNPQAALQVAAVVAGSYLVLLGTTEVLVVLQPAGQTARDARGARRRALASAAAAGALVLGALVLLTVTVTSGGPESGALAQTTSGKCNGSAALCESRVNEVAFAGTHNSFSAADSPGWYIANQRRTIDRQLRDGIRLFLIDPHWGVQSSGRAVRTDFKAEGRDRNRVAKALPPNVLKAAERLAGRLGAGDTRGKRELWLCHTVCELGATRMVDSLEGIRRFLDRNRGEVVILFIEPYVPPRDIAKAFEQAGLDRHVATLDRDEPLPTLGELVEDDRRVIVFTEKDADGTVPWYLDGFSFVQDTPLGATRVKQLSCRLARGDADSPLLMLNHWADLFPPRLEANRPFQTKRVLLDRAHRCARRRGLPVNLIAVDHYDQGELIAAVRELNTDRIRARRRSDARVEGG